MSLELSWFSSPRSAVLEVSPVTASQTLGLAEPRRGRDARVSFPRAGLADRGRAPSQHLKSSFLPASARPSRSSKPCGATRKKSEAHVAASLLRRTRVSRQSAVCSEKVSHADPSMKRICVQTGRLEAIRIPPIPGQSLSQDARQLSVDLLRAVNSFLLLAGSASPRAA